jgi:hypothetical protein
MQDSRWLPPKSTYHCGSHCLPALSAEQDKLLALKPAEQLLAVPMLHPDQVKDSLHG